MATASELLDRWVSSVNNGQMDMPATGKPVQVRAIAVLLEDAGRAAQIRHYIDIAGMHEQLEGKR